MKSLNKSIHEYAEQVKQGDLKQAYQGLMEFIRSLRIHLDDKYQEYNVSGSVYQGNMDISFFSLTTKLLKAKDLKVAVVYIHEKSWFEVWLTGRNSGVKNKYRKILHDMGFNKYAISPNKKGVDSIVSTVVVENPNFDHQVNLTRQIEAGVHEFVKAIEAAIN